MSEIEIETFINEINEGYEDYSQEVYDAEEEAGIIDQILGHEIGISNF